VKGTELNFIDRFLYKLLIGTFLLLTVVFFDTINVLNLKKLQVEISEHYNIMKILKALNGKTNFLIPIDISDQVSGEVNQIYMESQKIPNGRRVEVNEFQGVEVYKTGIVVEVGRNSDHTYRLKVKGIDDYDYIYDKLENISCNIYKIVQSGEVIGTPSYQDNNYYFEFYVYEKDQPVNLFYD